MNKFYYQIWRLKKDEQGRFLPILGDAITVKQERYEQIYDGTLASKTPNEGVREFLEDIFYIFNQAHPKDFCNYSLSISDIVVITHNDCVSVWFCDIVGWRNIFWEEPDNLSENKGEQNDD